VPVFIVLSFSSAVIDVTIFNILDSVPILKFFGKKYSLALYLVKWIRIRIGKHSMRMRIRQNDDVPTGSESSDPDPQYWFKTFKKLNYLSGGLDAPPEDW
jgi:hypothetical protein